jgi:CelD/BcsL family acetyltransferase involved in cellulose biosynthesis
LLANSAIWLSLNRRPGALSHTDPEVRARLTERQGRDSPSWITRSGPALRQIWRVRVLFVCVTLASDLVTELSELDDLHDRWDELAVENRLPMMSPACVTAWWRHLAPATAKPRVVVVTDSHGLVGIAPFFLEVGKRPRRLDYRLPGIELSARLAPLATQAHEAAVAEEVGRTLADCDPPADLIVLEGMPLASTWGFSLRDRWPSRPRPASSRYNTLGSPTVSLHAESFEAWLGAKSANFRGQMRRMRRQFQAAGGTTRASVPETLSSDIEVLMRLHAARWEGRGSSNFVALGESLPAMLGDIGRALLARDGRFRLQLLEIESEPISAQLFMAAGGHVLYVNGGWDERFARLKPPMLAILSAIEDAFDRNDRRVDLGIGVRPYKLRFADGDEPVGWTLLMPIGARLPLTYLSVGPTLAGWALRNAVKGRLSRERLAQYRELRARLHRTGIE